MGWRFDPIQMRNTAYVLSLARRYAFLDEQAQRYSMLLSRLPSSLLPEEDRFIDRFVDLDINELRYKAEARLITAIIKYGGNFDWPITDKHGGETNVVRCASFLYKYAQRTTNEDGAGYWILMLEKAVGNLRRAAKAYYKAKKGSYARDREPQHC